MSRRSDDTGSCDSPSVDPAAVARAEAGTPEAHKVRAAAAIFDAMGDPTRLRILLALDAAELCVCDLAELAEVSQSAVSHQLRVLRQLDLVDFTRDGKRAVYRLADDHVRDLIKIGLVHAAERGA